MPKAIVLGADAERKNIGSAIVSEFEEYDWEADGDNCRREAVTYAKYGSSAVHYSAPNMLALEPYEACVITLGCTKTIPFDQAEEQDLLDVIRGSLEVPVTAAHRYVRARQRVKARDPDITSHVVFIGSYAYRHPFTNGTAYCAAKAGLDMACKTLAWELTGEGFRFHIVHPWHVEGTGMWEEVQSGVMESRGWTREEADEYARRDLKMDTMLTPREVAQVVVSLVTNPPFHWTSGSSIELFGGVR